MNKITGTDFIELEKKQQESNYCFFSMGKPSKSAPFRYADIDVALRLQRNSTISSGIELDRNEMYLSEEVLSCETWQGRVLSVSDEYLQMEVRNDQFHDVKRTLRVRRSAVVNSDCAFIGAKALVSFVRIRNYRDRIINKTTVELNRIVDIPEEIKEKRYQDNMNRYSYMFEGEE